MKYVVLILIMIQQSVHAQIAEERNLLAKSLGNETIRNIVKSKKEWQKNQKELYKQKIDALPDSIKLRLVKEADKALQFDWPNIPSSLYLDYQKTGNRYNYEIKNSERRRVLSQLVIGELITHKAKYIPQIVNGLYVILEESTWVLPAHLVLQKNKKGLPDPNEIVIDLGAGNTASLIASTELMLGDDLNKVSTVINDRINTELKRRIFDPYLQNNSLWWMGMKGQAVNNWNAWINTNILQTLVFSQFDNDSTSALIIDKVIRSTDHFVNQYPVDGGCDEGPTYWSEAGGKLVRLLHFLHSLSNGKMNWSSDTLIYNMGTYIYKFHIADNYFVNFADAFPKSIPHPESVYRFGEIYKDNTLKSFAAYLFKLQKHQLEGNNLTDFLETTSIYNELLTIPAVAPLQTYFWLPQREILAVRSKAGSSDGLFLAVQGGNNGESHNHNDVGNFIVYANGYPVIIDAGVGSYTAKTFSNQRYTIWNMQSQWHNCPTINGIMQMDGKQFQASNLQFIQTKSSYELKMNIANAYPAEAAVKSWERHFQFNTKDNNITLKEKYELAEWKEPCVINFLSCATVKELIKGQLTFYNEQELPVLQMTYDTKNFRIVLEDKLIDDDRIKTSWGDKIYHIKMVSLNKQKIGGHEFKFSISQ